VRWRCARPGPRAVGTEQQQQQQQAAPATPQIDSELLERIQAAQLKAGAAADIYGIPAAEWLELQVRCWAAAARRGRQPGWLAVPGLEQANHGAARHPC
jgi:hypothetical protein